MSKQAFVRSFLAFVSAFAAAGLVGCGDGGGDHPAGDAARGETLYTQNCASCHGDDAKSGTAGENLPGELAEEGTDEIFQVVLNGKDGGEMPAFEGVLTEQEIADILAWIETQ